MLRGLYADKWTIVVYSRNAFRTDYPQLYKDHNTELIHKMIEFDDWTLPDFELIYLVRPRLDGELDGQV
jgi:hypothetical protein